jgi:hypothetical protein
MIFLFNDAVICTLINRQSQYIPVPAKIFFFKKKTRRIAWAPPIQNQFAEGWIPDLAS